MISQPNLSIRTSQPLLVYIAHISDLNPDLPPRNGHPTQKYKHRPSKYNPGAKPNHAFILSPLMMQYRACNRRPRQPRYRNKPASHPHHGAYLAHVPADTCDRGVLDTYHCALEKAEEDGKDVKARFRHAEPGEYGDAVHECEGDQDVEARGLVRIPGGGVRAEFVGYEAWEYTAEGGGAVDDGEEVECCSWCYSDL